jgi:peptide deformylase
MILPIIAYGDPVLRKMGQEITKDYPDLDKLIINMWDTMYEAYGVGLAAPQVNYSIRLFMIDPSPFAEDENLTGPEKEVLSNLKKVFINPKIIAEEGEEWAFNEGCLSIPEIREDVFRKPRITIEYLDEDFNMLRETYEGLAARVIQHEYDHIEGILFTDKLSSLKKRLIKGKLSDISKGKVDVDYRMRFPAMKKGR